MLILLFPLLLGSTAALARTEHAQLTGLVRDLSGAVVPAAEIRVTNVATGIRRTATSNELGIHTVPLLEPGGYRVNVQRQGFRSIEHTGITLEVNQVAPIDFTLGLKVVF